ncbi:MAG: sigma-70 family RNA polymerase sigma factor [Deltaproteobacteria bacterium]|nr:MAG: sigma-70 family RNA polymerase sigma factor [Deltaproteobacteria bacterium]
MAAAARDASRVSPWGGADTRGRTLMAYTARDDHGPQARRPAGPRRQGPRDGGEAPEGVERRSDLRLDQGPADLHEADDRGEREARAGQGRSPHAGRVRGARVRDVGSGLRRCAVQGRVSVQAAVDEASAPRGAGPPTLGAALHVLNMDCPETLLEHATWLRRLAASLVGDRATADDLVQDTWVAALRCPPDLNRPLRPWLARVVRNAARFRWRGDAHRAAREAVATRDAETITPTTEELLARHQLQQLLARLVGELDEPFRGAILLRYAEGLEPTQIAHRLGIPASTVRWRIKEGLERLRRALDDAHGGESKAWLLALAPIALWPRASHAAPAVPLAAAIMAAAGIVLVLVLVLVLGLGAIRRASGVRATKPRGAIAPSLATRAREGIAPSWFVQPGAPSRHVTGRVVRDGVPVPGAQVRLVADDAEPQETRSRVDGRFDFGVQAARTVTLGASIPDALAAIRHLDLRDPGIAAEIELPLVTCSARIAGKVNDASGNPIPHAQVLRENTIGTETDDAGAYELCALPTAALVAQLDLVIRAGGYGTIVTGVAPAGHIRRDFVLAPEATITGAAAASAAVWIEPDRDDLSRTGERGARQVAIADSDGRRIGGAARGAIGGAQVSGTVAGPSGAPVANVSVRFTSADHEQARCMTDTAGAFTCGSLKGTTSYTPTVFPGDGDTRPFPFVIPAPAIDLGLDASIAGVHLVIDPRTTTLAGTVLDDTGAPAVDVRVHATGDGLFHYGWLPSPTVTTDVAGRFRFEHLAPGDYELDAETLHDGRSAMRVVAAGASDVVLTLTRPACTSGTPLDPPHKPTAPILWDDRIELIGWDIPDRARVGEPVQVTLVFRARALILHPWNVFAHFDGSQHRKNADHPPVGEYCTTSTWRPGDVLVDRFSTTLPFSETYALKIGFFRPGEGDGPWQNLVGAGDVVGGVELGTITAVPAE